LNFKIHDRDTYGSPVDVYVYVYPFLVLEMFLATTQLTGDFITPKLTDGLAVLSGQLILLLGSFVELTSSTGRPSTPIEGTSLCAPQCAAKE
jgi:hypothetical protein